MSSYVTDDTQTQTQTQTTERRRRIICSGCERPTSVCLCALIPTSPPSTTNTEIIILQHPHEQRHPLATVPVLNKCLTNCHVLTGRRLRRGKSDLLDQLYNNNVDDDGNSTKSIHAAFLFPGTDLNPSMEINQWKSSFGDTDVNKFVLIAFDGTWKHAKEMVSASFPFVSKFATQVSLTYDVNVDGGNIFSNQLTLRKEPFDGCMSTMEAVARCLRVLEPNGVEIESRLVEVLRMMVKFQASFTKPINPRPKLSKKGKNNDKQINSRT